MTDLLVRLWGGEGGWDGGERWGILRNGGIQVMGDDFEIIQTMNG